MGCRPAKFSKVTDSIVTYSNGIKITSGKEKTNQTNDESNTNHYNDTENGRIEESKNERNSMISNNINQNSRTTRRANRRIGPSREISPIFKNVPSIVLQRSKSQIEFFLKLEDKINQGMTSHQNECLEIESI